MEQHTIRFAKPDDMPQIIELCAAHALYEEATYDANHKENQLSEAIFGIAPKLYCLVIASGNELLGYATFMRQYSTWDAGEYIYMDCLFLKENARGQRLGEALIERIKMEGKKWNCSLIQWQTPEFNVRAIKFYKRIGAYSKSKERFFLEIM